MLGEELDVAGAFLYAGIRELHETGHFHFPEDTFLIQYNLSVGLERVFKVAILLSESSKGRDLKSAVSGLKKKEGHDLIALMQRLDRVHTLDLRKSQSHLGLLEVLTAFYRRNRYGRYEVLARGTTKDNASSYRHDTGIGFLDFINDELQLGYKLGNPFSPWPNTNEVRRWLGHQIKEIVDELYSIICMEARELGIRTGELRVDSKACWTFGGGALDFLREESIKKELILFLMNPTVSSRYIDKLRSAEPLGLPPDRAADYIKALLRYPSFSDIEDEVEDCELPEEAARDRRMFLEIMDTEHYVVGEDPEE